MDHVRVFDLILVGLKDRIPRTRVAVELLGDLRQRVAAGDGIGLVGSCGRRSSGGTARLHVGKIRSRRFRCRRGRSGRTALYVGEIRFRIVSHVTSLTTAKNSMTARAKSRQPAREQAGYANDVEFALTERHCQ